ncbi:hypothetical protein J3R30DRAFT_3700896 [Lentinula aciculospora]|uniref:Protein kinase domain-containing protein n=1 Tax=Lentinula aciculospora TaxID=153920 RepID=A0A9W9DQ99_9AGAR|nr:hypothetical protein J3R30DRAFT_3700896 [Lentinula aciculospora]
MSNQSKFEARRPDSQVSGGADTSISQDERTIHVSSPGGGPSLLEPQFGASHAGAEHGPDRDGLYYIPRDDHNRGQSSAIDSPPRFHLRPTDSAVQQEAPVHRPRQNYERNSLNDGKNERPTHIVSEQVYPLPDRQVRQTTPEPEKRHPISASAVLETPFGKKSSSYTPSLSYDKKHTVDEANIYLDNDLAFNVRVLPVNEWTKHCLNLDLDKDSYNLSPTVEDSFAQYLEAVDTATSEKDPKLYSALIDLLNSISNGDTEDKIIFYLQDPTPVRGSLVGQTPDIGAVFKGLLENENVKDLKNDGKIVWGHMASLVEGKLAKGRMIRSEIGVHVKKESMAKSTPIAPGSKGKQRESSSKTKSNANKKRSRDGDADERVSKTRRTTDDSVPAPIKSDVPAGTDRAARDPTSESQPHKLKDPPPRNSREGVRTQVAGYARDMLSHGLLRTHVILFVVDSQLVRGFFYDRSIIVESELLDLTDKDHQLIFAKMIKHMRALSPEGLGIVPALDATDFLTKPASLKYGQDIPQYSAADGPPSNEIFERPIGSKSLFEIPYKDGNTRTVILKRVLFRSNGIIGRGTTVVRVECACLHCGTQCDWKGKKLILKLSFPGKNRVPEHTLMERCRELAHGEHGWVLDHLPHIYWSFDVPFHDRTPQANLKKKLEGDYEMRIMRGSIQEELYPISTLKTAKGCAQVFYDVVQCHHWAWKYPQILHRDISHGNIMVREKDGRKYGVLNDWDLAVFLNSQGDGPTSKFRTGTKPYMSYEQHSDDWQGPHRFRHDLESVFYVILLLACLYSSPCEQYRPEIRTRYEYEEWLQQDDFFLYNHKHTVIINITWQSSVMTFFKGFERWLNDLQFALCSGLLDLAVHNRTAREQHQVTAFDHDSLGGHFTYKKVVLIMHIYDKEELETRGQEWQEILQLDMKL